MQAPRTHRVQNKKGVGRTKTRAGGRLCFPDWDQGQGRYIYLFSSSFEKRVSRYCKNNVVRSEYSKAREQRAPGRERVQIHFFFRVGGRYAFSLFIFLPSHIFAVRVSRYKNVERSEYSEAREQRAPGRERVQNKKGGRRTKTRAGGRLCFPD